MVFAMKGGGSRVPMPILKDDFFENHLESFPDSENVFCTIVWALYYVNIVVEVTLNLAK